MAFSRQHRSDVQKAPNRGFHQIHRPGQLVDLGDDRMGHDGFMEIEMPDAGGLADQTVQMAGDPAGQQPGDRQRQQHQPHRDQNRLIANLGRVGQQFALGHGQRQR